MSKIDYIEFKAVDAGIECTWRYKNAITKIKTKEAKKIFKYLNEYNFEYKSGITDGKKAIRFYGVGNEIMNLLKENKKNTKSKVSRFNKYKDLIAPIAGITAAAVFLGGVLYYIVKGSKPGEKHNDEPITTTIGMEIQPNTESTKAKAIETTTEDTKIADNIIVPDSYFDFEFEDRSYTDKANKTRELYYDVIDKYSKMYGLPTNLMVAVATQECGVHQTTRSPGGGFGLFQIQVGDTGWNWMGNNITAYNFETKENETVNICRDSSGNLRMDMLANLEYNVKIGCMIMSSELKRSDYDIVCALQSYNSGNQPRKLKKNYGEDWVNHRDGVPGDEMYLEHVLSYISPDDNILQYFDANNNSYAVAINNVYNRAKSLS